MGGFFGKFKKFFVEGLLLILVVVFVLVGAQSVRTGTSAEGLAITQKAIHRALVQCYAIEGAYPPGVDYLEENYGVQIDHDRYFVYYEAYGQNMMPDVVVAEK
ncbi:hypothetical protein SDC9_198045 [bioreactor metagenome]|uniref:Type II secretion system protein GspG C-terminal domain-containing protein n=1 Tax=bioreactor metagenome TaxID=1076179 RepID=A0A645IIV8_9ZZZZ